MHKFEVNALHSVISGRSMNYESCLQIKTLLRIEMLLQFHDFLFFIYFLFWWLMMYVSGFSSLTAVCFQTSAWSEVRKHQEWDQRHQASQVTMAMCHLCWGMSKKKTKNKKLSDQSFMCVTK